MFKRRKNSVGRKKLDLPAEENPERDKRRKLINLCMWIKTNAVYEYSL